MAAAFFLSRFIPTNAPRQEKVFPREIGS